MGAIPIQDARGLFTQALIDAYKETPKPTAFLRSFFPTKESATKNVGIAVKRGSEKVAVDVIRGGDGNRNTFGKSTQKLIEPPMYNEYFDLTELDIYDRLWNAQGEIDAALVGEGVAEANENLMELVAKIERAYELQCAQVLETGIVTLKSGANIDFKRKPGSKVAKSGGTYWTTGTVNPFTDLEAGANFIRKEGKAQGSIINLLMGSEALNAFLENDIVKARADIRNFQLDSVAPGVKNSVGGLPYAEVWAGSYKFRIWTYPEFYEDRNNANALTAYLNPKKVVFLPEMPRFKLGFGLVPQLPENGNVQKGAYAFFENRDTFKVKHEISVRSAGIAVPVAVDQIYTLQPIA